jgi:hypothetical protein
MCGPAAATTAALMKAAYVYVRSPPAAPSLSPAYRGPYRVVERGPKSFQIAIGTRLDRVSVDRIKPHHGDAVTAAETQAATAPSSSVEFPCPDVETKGGSVDNNPSVVPVENPCKCT